MARPMRTGLSYFPLDTNFLSDRKIQRLSIKHGCRGIMTYLAVLCEIYETNGYFVSYTDDFCQDIGFTLHLEEAVVDEIVRFCVKVHLFDNAMWTDKQVLTSRGIQTRCREICTHRLGFRIDPALCLTGDAGGGRAVSAAQTPVAAAETPVSDALTPSYIKGKETKEKNTTNTPIKRTNENRASEDNADSARRAELQRMADRATGGC